MKRLLPFALLVCGISAAAQSAPTKTDVSIWTGLAAARTADWITTEECQRRPWKWCHESIMPTALVRDKAGFTSFEIATTAGGILGQRWIETRRHPRLAFWLQAGSVAAIAGTSANNWRVARR